VKVISIRRWIWLTVRLLLAWKVWPRILAGWLRQIQQGPYLAQKMLRRLRKMVAWVPWVTRLVDLRPAILLQPQWTLQMPLLVQLWTALWIKVVRPHRQVQKERQIRQELACPLKTMAQR
jgi:hypothetical protein